VFRGRTRRRASRVCGVDGDRGRDAPTLADGEGFTEAFPRLDLVDTERLDDGIVLSYEVGDGTP